MNKDDRLILGRIDERTRNTWKTVEKIEQRLTVMNGEVKRNTIWRKVTVYIGSVLIATILTKVQGLW